jgi:HPt (histidine-containing phosphotransfer) domain-containing protein
VRDATKALAVLDEIMKKIEKAGSHNEEDIRTYVINVHGMKSALANIGKMNLSATALKLEQSGRENNIEVIKSETPAFLDSLRAFIDEITPKTEHADSEAVDENKPYLHEKLLAIKTACEEYDKNAADDLLAGLRKKTWTPSTKEQLNTIAEHLLHSDFDEVVSVVDEIIKA